MFENIRDDLRAYDGNWGAQGFWVMVVYRFGRWRYGIRPVILRKLFSLIYRVTYKFIQVITGIELPCEATVGRNFVIDHFGGIIISGYAKFGDNCRIRNGVVVGLRRIDEKYAPDHRKQRRHRRWRKIAWTDSDRKQRYHRRQCGGYCATCPITFDRGRCACGQSDRAAANRSL